MHGSKVKKYVQLPRDVELIRNTLCKQGSLFISFHVPLLFDEHVGGIFTDYYGERQINRKRDHTSNAHGMGNKKWTRLLDYKGTWWEDEEFFKIKQ